MKTLILQTSRLQCLLILIFICNKTNAQYYDFKVVNEGSSIYYIVRGNSATVVKGESNYSDVVNIPSVVSYEGIDYSVIAIGDFAFSNCGDITSITLPPSLLSIGKYAFDHCTSLKSIDIPNSVLSIGSWAFWSCTNLVSVKLSSSIKAIESYLFNECANLKSLGIPSSVRRIGDRAFQGCKRLSTVSIPNSVTSIGKSAFQECRSLESLSIPNQLTTIEQYTFSNCSRLTTLTIPNSVTYIDEWAFWGCSALKTVYLPSSVNYVGGWAFSSCNAIEALYSEIDNPFPISEYVFERDVKSKAILHVPEGTKEAYQNVNGWNFNNIVEDNLTSYNFVIWAKDGTKIAEYALMLKPKVTFDKNRFTVISDGVEIEYFELGNLARFTYEKSSGTAISSILTDETIFRFSGESIYFPSLKENSTISVFSLNGTPVFRKTVQQDGDYLFPIPNLNAGVYVVHVNGSTFKIIKKK